MFKGKVSFDVGGGWRCGLCMAGTTSSFIFRSFFSYLERNSLPFRVFFFPRGFSIPPPHSNYSGRKGGRLNAIGERFFFL